MQFKELELSALALALTLVTNAVAIGENEHVLIESTKTHCTKFYFVGTEDIFYLIRICIFAMHLLYTHRFISLLVQVS